MSPTSTNMHCRLFPRGTVGSEGVFSGTDDGAQTKTLVPQSRRDQSILLIENDPALGDLIVECLQLNGFDVVWARNGIEGVALLSREEPALVILNWMLPQLDGVTLLHRARQAGVVCPALVLTAAQESSDPIAGLRAGAESYLAKPFTLSDLLTRVRGLMQSTSRAESLTCADLQVDTLQRQAMRAGSVLELTACEYRILEFLMRHHDKVVLRQRLAEVVAEVLAGQEPESSESATPRGEDIDLHVACLQRKLEDGGKPRLLHTVRGVGFCIKG